MLEICQRECAMYSVRDIVVANIYVAKLCVFHASYTSTGIVGTTFQPLFCFLCFLVFLEWTGFALATRVWGQAWRNRCVVDSLCTQG